MLIKLVIIMIQAQNWKVSCLLQIARHYNPRFVYFLPQFCVRFILQTIYVAKQGRLGIKSAVYNQEQVIMYDTFFSDRFQF
jgi:hypothetical protein